MNAGKKKGNIRFVTVCSRGEYEADKHFVDVPVGRTERRMAWENRREGEKSDIKSKMGLLP